MSMLAAIVPRLASLAAQPAVLAAGVATGVAVGAVGVGTGAIPVTDPGPRLAAVYECPDSARIVKNLASDQKVLVTARTADGEWLELYLGEPGAERGWARAASLQLAAAPASLPVADCTPVTAPEPTLEAPTSLPSPVPSELPSSGPTDATGAPPTAPGSPGPTIAPTKTPKPTPTPLTGPVLSNVYLYAPAQEGDGVYRIYYRDYYYCPYAWDNVALTVESVDTEGTSSVTLYFQATGSSVESVAMADENGQATLWDGGFSAASDWAKGTLKVWLQAVDTAGNPGPILDLKDLGYTFEVGNCVPPPTPSPTPTP